MSCRGRFHKFQTSCDNLVNIHNKDEECEIDSSMIIPILAEYSLVFNEENLYQFKYIVITEFFDDLNLQIWFPKEEMEAFICIKDNCLGEDKSKNSIILYKDVEEFKNEIVTEIEFCGKEKTLRFLELD